MLWFVPIFTFVLVFSGCQGFQRPKGLKEATINPKVSISRWDQKFNNVGKLFGNVAIYSSEKQSTVCSPIKTALLTATIQTLDDFSFDAIDLDKGYIETEWFSVPKHPNHRFKLCCTIDNQPDWINAIQVKACHQTCIEKKWVDQGYRQHLAFDIKERIITNARRRQARTHSKKSEVKIINPMCNKT